MQAIKNTYENLYVKKRLAIYKIEASIIKGMHNLKLRKLIKYIKPYTAYNSKTLMIREKLLYPISNNRANRIFSRLIPNPLNKREGMLYHTYIPA